MRGLLSKRAKKQWESPAYKAFMAEKFKEFYRTNATYREKNNALLAKAQREHWTKPEHRKAQSKRIVAFFSGHPELRDARRTEALTQWTDTHLRAWRSQETKKQWTSDFRAKRKAAYDRTYLAKALRVFNDVWKKTGDINTETYDRVRKETGDRSLIRYETILGRFFNGDTERFQEAVTHFNHRIVRIEAVTERMDVYDIEVPGTHNFALANGIFVHNSSKQGRDRRTQAILPLRGKILNVERARLDKMLASNEIKNLVIAMGTAIGDLFDISKLRYHKIIIATDADVDGAHIRTLLLTLFYRYFRAVIEGGFLYIAQPPLYKVTLGKEIHYAFTDTERDQVYKKLGIIPSLAEITDESETESEEELEDGEEEGKGKNAKQAKPKKPRTQRYKGLGEMNPEELWETTMDPERRVLKQVKIEDAQDADRVFDILMGTDVPARKSFIQSNAKSATIDV